MIVVWGFGSIGQRHLNNILELGYTNVAVITRRPQQVTGSFAEKIQILSKPESINWKKVTHLIIATPTSLHHRHLEFGVNKHVAKIYVEKPISHSAEGLATIETLISDSTSDVYVGYDMRYDPGVVKTKEILQNEDLGNVCSFHSHVGQYLPEWRPSQDYRKSMSALESLGGGVMLDLSHEIDYICYLFGEIDWVMNSNGERGDLSIETEDTSDSIVHFKNGYSGTMHLDYLQRPAVRYLHIIGSRGSLNLDFIQTHLTWQTDNNRESQELDYSSFSRNDRFMTIMKDFLSKQSSKILCPWEEGVKSLNIILESKISNRVRSIRLIN